MPRTARLVVPGYPFHITQRGNFGFNVFDDDRDRVKYLNWVNKYSRKFYLSHIGYCLMRNHVHFISIPQKEDSLSKVFSIVHMRYSQYFNKKRNNNGHLWQGRYYSCLLDDTHLLMALRYVERNPVRANITTKPWNWKWSSAADHTGIGNGILELKGLSEYMEFNPRHWKEYLDSQEDKKELNEIRKHTMKGFPLGSKDFLIELSNKTGIEIKQNPRGRPRNNDG